LFKIKGTNILTTLLENILLKQNDVTLSELIESRRQELGLSKRQLERVLQMDYNTIESAKDGDIKRFSVVNTVKLANFLGIDLQNTVEVIISNIGTSAIEELEKVRKSIYLIKNFDLDLLKKIRFIESIQDFDEIEKRIINFFGFTSIFEYESDLGNALFSKTRQSANDKMKEFWVRSAYAYFEKINNPNSYDRDLLIDLIPKIKPYTRNLKYGLKTVALALRNAGVNLIYQPHLSTTQVRGGTFLVNDTPSIVLTDLNKNYATIWFALLHELHHVLYDLEHLETTKYHLTGDHDLFLLQEEKANEFARDYLFALSDLKYIEPFIHNHSVVETYAKECQIHPCIVYSMFQHYMDERGENYWGAFKQYSPDVNVALEGFNKSMWEYDTIQEATEKLEQAILNI